MYDKFAKLETYNNGVVYILVSNISSIQEYETLDQKYTSICMNSGDRHTVKCSIDQIWEILQK